MLSSVYSINDFILIATVLVAFYFDLTSKKIPNLLTFPVIVWGLLFNTVMQGSNGFLFSLYGLLLGLAIFFIPFAMGGMGGGDVKLMGAIGALQGWQFVLSTALLAGIFGGVMSLVFLILNRRLSRGLKKMVGIILTPFFNFLFRKTGLDFFSQADIYFSKQDPAAKEPIKLPYGVAIATGVLVFMFINLSPWSESVLGKLPW